MYNANLIIPEGSYTNIDAIPNVINYIFGITKRSRKSVPAGCYGVFPPTAENAILQFQTTRAESQNTPKQQLWHFYISIADPIDPYTLHKYADQIAYIFASHYQICYGIHLDTDHSHVHFAVSACSYIVDYPNLSPEILLGFIKTLKTISSDFNTEITYVEIKNYDLHHILLNLETNTWT